MRRLSPDDGAEYETFAWSPDGTQLAFDRFEQNDKSLHEGIYVMGADGSDLQEIYRSDQKPVSVQDLAWSPDGSQITFVRTQYAQSGSEADDRLDLFIMDADGSGLRQLTFAVAGLITRNRIAKANRCEDHALVPPCHRESLRPIGRLYGAGGLPLAL